MTDVAFSDFLGFGLGFDGCGLGPGLESHGLGLGPGDMALLTSLPIPVLTGLVVE